MITLESILAQAKIQIDGADADNEIYILHTEAVILKNSGATVRQKNEPLAVASNGRHFTLELNGIKFTHTCYPGNRNCEAEPLI